MDVTIYYTREYDQMPGGVKRVTTPLESGWDVCKVYFRAAEDDPGTWMLRVEGTSKTIKGETSTPKRDLLKRKCGTIEKYAQWLERHVSYIEVDGRVFWAPQAEGEEV